MSIRVMTAVWDGFPGGGSDLLVMLALSDWSDDEGRCYPAISSLARKTRLSTSQARRVAHGLIDRGFVIVTGNENGGAPGASRKYQIVIDRLNAKTACTDATPSVDARGSANARDGLHGCAETTSANASQPVIEPSITVSANFAQFWKAYPKKKSRKDAEKAFKVLKVDDALLETMLSAIAVATQSSDWQKDNGQFIPYPARWLRAGSWEDEISQPSTAKKARQVVL